MTFTAIALDPDTGALGIGIATYSLAVGASCPFVRPGIGAVSTQAATNAAHGPELLNLIASGENLGSALTALRASDRYFEYRQIGLVTISGQTQVHTGSETRHWAGSLTGDGWLVMGNVLAGEQVAHAMGKVMEQGGIPLSERLVLALEAGRDAGGQVGVGGKHLPERSTVVSVYENQPYPELDLRVDDHPDAVTELRRIFDRFNRADGYYRQRALAPDTAGPQDTWMAENDLE